MLDGHASVRALVLGVGNPLMSDDGVGLRVLQALEQRLPALVGADYVDAGTLSLLLLPRIEQCDALLLLDAAQLDVEPGAVQVFEGPAMDGFLAASRCSVHEVGMRDLLDAARLMGCLPERRVLVGVQPARVGWGEALSAPVESAIPGAVSLARDILERWLGPVPA